MRGLKSQSLQFAGVFDGADYGLGFVEGLLVFEFGTESATMPAPAWT